MLFETKMSPELMALLLREEVLNLNLLGVLENFSHDQLKIYTDSLTAPTGILVQRDPYFHFLYTRNLAFVDAIFDEYLTEGYFGFSGIAMELADYILSKHRLDWTSHCDLYTLAAEDLNRSLKTRDVGPLALDHAELVDTYYPYRHERSIDDIRECIQNRPTAAYFIDQAPVCWLLIHNDNSLGFMHTLDDHRRHGYAVDVTIDLCDRLLQAGKKPYLQIVKINDKSPGLALKCGFKKVDEVMWVGVIVGNPAPIEEN